MKNARESRNSLSDRLRIMAADPIVGPLCSALLLEAASALTQSEKRDIAKELIQGVEEVREYVKGSCAPSHEQRSEPFSLRHLQQHLPWTIPYSEEFQASADKNAQRRIGHDVLHVMKSLGRIAADVEAADHERPRKLIGDSFAKEVADLVICALHIARLEGFDLHDAVVTNSEARNAATIPPEYAHSANAPAVSGTTPTTLQGSAEASGKPETEARQSATRDRKMDGVPAEILEHDYRKREGLLDPSASGDMQLRRELGAAVMLMLQSGNAECAEFARRIPIEFKTADGAPCAALAVCSPDRGNKE